MRTWIGAVILALSLFRFNCLNTGYNKVIGFHGQAAMIATEKVELYGSLATSVIALNIWQGEQNWLSSAFCKHYLGLYECSLENLRCTELYTGTL